MTDAALRTLEREARQGDPTVQARLLAERVRAGDLPPEDLELAARLGHPTAVAATGPLAPGTAWLPLGDVTRGWWRMRRFLGQLAQRRPMAVAEWLLEVYGSTPASDSFGWALSFQLLETWVQNPRRLECPSPPLLLPINPDRCHFLTRSLRRFQEQAGKLSKEGCDVVVAQRLRLAEFVLRHHEEPLPRWRGPRTTAERNAFYASSMLQCANCNVSGTTLGGMHAFMHWHPDPSLVLCDACHRQRAAAARGATS